MPALLYRESIPRPGDPDVYGPLVDAFLKGHSQPKAAALAGIHEDTLYHWRYRGEAQLAEAQGRHIPWSELGSHAQLVIRIKEADAMLEGEILDNWRTDPHWARWPTLAERKWPQDWGRRDQLQIEQRSVTLTISAVAEPATLAELQRRLLTTPAELPSGT